jgi:hypothetical protein
VARFGLRGPGALRGHVLPHGFIEQRLIDFRAKYGVSELNRTNCCVIQIDNIYTRHRFKPYRFARRTIT